MWSKQHKTNQLWIQYKIRSRFVYLQRQTCKKVYCIYLLFKTTDVYNFTFLCIISYRIDIFYSSYIASQLHKTRSIIVHLNKLVLKGHCKDDSVINAVAYYLLYTNTILAIILTIYFIRLNFEIIKKYLQINKSRCTTAY